MDTAIWFSVSNRSIYLLGGVLTVDQGVCRWRFKNREIGDVFNYCWRTRRDAAKRTTALDSAHWIDVSTLSKDVLTVDEGVCRWRFKICGIWDVFAYCQRPNGVTAKWTPPFDSAHRIGLSTRSEGVLTVDEGVCRWGFKICGIWDVFNYCGRTRTDTEKRRWRLDSAHGIGLETIFSRILRASWRCFLCRDVNHDGDGGVFQSGLIFGFGDV